ncbi:MAG: molybdopterin-dependent oxidoreductase [Deltaproteobacteria bacterium]|nr:molybdopterin-dependent oxidoreductase [Deltaproteobacteria bacterium]
MAEDIRRIKTHCSRMDHGGCGIILEAKGNRIISIKADPDGFLNKGHICVKGLNAAGLIDHPSRLRHPVKRAGVRGGGKWERISWDEAIDTICDNLRLIRDRYGARAVAFCQGMPKGMEHFALIRLANIFGSPNVVGNQDVCHAPRELSGKYTCGFYPVPDLRNKTELVVAWGSDNLRTNEEGAICSQLLGRLREGTRLIVIDPMKTTLAEKAGCWLQPRPGTDNALALAFLNVIINERLYDIDFVEKWTHGFYEFSRHVMQYTPEIMSEITWVPAGLIRDAARAYALARPASILWGNALEHNVNAFDSLRAITCLMAITGNLDVPGGNIHANEPDILRLGELVRADMLPSKKTEMINAHCDILPGMMTIPPTLFRRAVLDGRPYPVQGAYIMGANPLLTYGDSKMTVNALMKLDFIAASDIFITPTALFADIVMPAASAFEFNDIGNAGLGHGYILARPKVVDPPDECWPEMKIINEIGKRLTSGELWYDDYNEFLDELLSPSGFSFREFARLGHLEGAVTYRKYERKGFKTPSGKVELVLSRSRELKLPAMPCFTNLPENEDPEFPLVLTGKKDRFYPNSSYRFHESLKKHSRFPIAEINPDTAEIYGIKDGDEISITTKNGEISQSVRVTDRIHPKVIYASYGWWFPESGIDAQYDWMRSNYNILISADNIGKEFGTPNMKGIGCSIRKK